MSGTRRGGLTWRVYRIKGEEIATETHGVCSCYFKFRMAAETHGVCSCYFKFRMATAHGVCLLLLNSVKNKGRGV